MRKASSHWSLVVVVALLSASVAAAEELARGVPPVPTYTLMPRTDKSIPLGTVILPGAPANVATTDLAKLGYVEEEYLLKGTANIYSPDGLQLVKPAVPYVTRMLLVRPADRRKWSGDIQLSALRNGREWSEGWELAREYMLDHGDIWVGLTVSNENVSRYHNVFDKARYADLRVPEDGFRYDLMTQVAWLLRSPDGLLAKIGFTRPDVKVISSGWSMNGSLQVALINGGHHARARTPAGGPVIDGYIPGITNAVLQQLPADAAVLRMNSETEVLRGKQALAIRRPDSNSPDARFRLYELASTVHGGREMSYLKPPAYYQVNGAGGPNKCMPLPVDTRGGKRHFAAAAYANMSDWLRKNIPPPPGRVIELDSEGNILRDADGFARGGLRPYWTAVPTSRIEVMTRPQPQGGMGQACSSYGGEERFPADRLKQFYPKTKTYVDKVTGYVDGLVRERYLRAVDAARDRERAKQDQVP